MKIARTESSENNPIEAVFRKRTSSTAPSLTEIKKLICIMTMWS
jgi:hypothetical protein